MKKLFFTVLMISFLFGCQEDNLYNPQVQLEDDVIEIRQYIQDNNLINAKEDASGVFYVIEVEGTGTEMPNFSANVSVAYRGYLMDGTEFDSASSVNPFTTALSSTITGWQFGIPHFKKGGKGKLLIPSPLAYGNSAVGSIPSRSILIFDIELLDFTN